jgi:O-antigen biosynthesis protein
MDISIVIVNYNVQYFLEQCLISVQRALSGVNAEVFVVDNNSVDGSVLMVQQKFPWVKLIANEQNTGFSKANNQAMRLAKGEHILLLNPDTVIEEDTLSKVLAFMKKHPECGGLGVKMVDGKGVFLPESKRGLPTPETAFYKIFGLSRLFQKSKRFNRYYLGHLSNDEVHEIEILSGAFMWMRKAALDKVGLLDEAFFMYGEDIDLSWRIIQGGYKNYYFPETRIIHYKGESTKKGSLNYVYVFYNAMVIFARKHFSKQNADLFSFFIQAAIWLRAGVAILFRFLKSIFLPALDVVLMLGLLMALKSIYAASQHKIYDDSLVLTVFVVCSLLWSFGAYLGSGYDKPLRPLRVMRPIALTSAFIIMAYSFLPEEYRFSRALMLFGGLGAFVVFFLNRVMVNLINTGKTGLEKKKSKRIAILGGLEEVERVLTILKQTSYDVGFIARVAPRGMGGDGFLSRHDQLNDTVRVHAIDEVVFCAKDVSSSDIISSMSSVSDGTLEFKIAPPESLYIIGSNSVETSGDVFILDVNSVSKKENRRSKRWFDFAMCLAMLPLLPLLLALQLKPLRFLINWFHVGIGKKTWVGYSTYGSGSTPLPALKPAVIDTASHLKKESLTQEQLLKLNILYAKDYRLSNDVRMMLRSFRQWGS